MGDSEISKTQGFLAESKVFKNLEVFGKDAGYPTLMGDTWLDAFN